MKKHAYTLWIPDFGEFFVSYFLSLLHLKIGSNEF